MFVPAGNRNIHCDVRGEGSPVLLLHGWGANIEAMLPIANCVAAMGKKAITPEFPGFGESAAPDEVWGVPEYADCIRKLMDQLGITGADVVCHSFGGRVAIWLASHEPQLFRRIVLVDAAGVRPKRGWRYYVRTYRYKLGKRMARVRWIDARLHLSERRQQAGSADYRALSGVMRGTFVKVVNQDLTNRLPLIKNPTLLIWGEDDRDTPLYMAQIMEKKIPDCGLVTFSGAGHFSYADQYPRFCAVLQSFLKD